MIRRKLLLLGVILALLSEATPYVAREYEGQAFCGKPGTPNRCCLNRLDDCSHFIAGTKCYCDEFCVRNGTKHDDCCPDYRAVCLGERAAGGARLEQIVRLEGECDYGQSKTENCNTCSCEIVQDKYTKWKCTTHRCIIEEPVLDAVRHSATTWTAQNYTQFWGRTLHDGLHLLLGTLPLSSPTKNMKPVPHYPKADLPPSFDARTQWPGYITPVYDQGWCGADWAVSTAAVVSDRFAIQSKGKEHVTLSAQNLLCFQKGCGGGQLELALSFVFRIGLVEDMCYPYRGQSPARPCPNRNALKRTSLESFGCDKARNGRTEKYKISPAKRLGSVDDIKQDIMHSGPVQAIMKVKQDFFAYKSGIYRHVKSLDNSYGLHSVRIIGWGEERGQKYWLVANSWGPQWGEDGFFRIARGENESDIENFVLSAIPLVYHI